MQDVDLGKSVSSPILRSDNIVMNLKNTFGFQGNGIENSQNHVKRYGIKIEPEVIAKEISYWQPSIVCYVVRTNPPVSILDGFARRLWKYILDKVGVLSRGIFIIRFHNLEFRDRVLDGGYLFFGKKPFIMKSWNSVDDFTKEDITTVPTWIQQGGLDIKYWGERFLFKIVGQLGKPIQVDNITKHRDRLYYPQILIEVSLDQEFPNTIVFTNECDQEKEILVTYKWIPIVCQNCSGMGHETMMCRKKNQVKQTWVPKKIVTEKIPAIMSEEDDEGFQKVVKGKKVLKSSAISITVTNQSPYWQRNMEQESYKDMPAERAFDLYAKSKSKKESHKRQSGEGCSNPPTKKSRIDDPSASTPTKETTPPPAPAREATPPPPVNPDPPSLVG
ncbi:uncharacterized protein LOC133805795 [Humulus lupulus]|uniref:uncharacterized protein LOC133805795 n=1 Tax=Humulus lupulus TaxID=3486 RepID=UPI002B401334|nr:uncharacterized protein LOC133805795 [Humulus lupulus]